MQKKNHCLFLAVLASAISSHAMAGEQYAGLDPARIAEIAALLPAEPAGFGKPCTDRSAWENPQLRARFDDKKVIADAEALLSQPFPAWDDALYLDFSKTGRRPPGEAMLSRRAAWLYPLVIAECLENRGRFVPALNMILDQYCGERTWTLPAHDGDLACFNGTKYIVELRSAGFAADLAQALYLLGDKIKPQVRERVQAQLEKRIFAPMREAFRTGKGEPWLRVHSNWNAVCLAGVTSAALADLPDRADRALFAAAAEHYSRSYLAGFTDDGYCVEGTGYWDYGFSNFVELRERLLQSTGNRLDLFADPKIRNIALFGARIQMNDGLVPPFEDCRPGTRVPAALLTYCNRSLGLGLPGYEKLMPVRHWSLTQACMAAFPNAATHPQPATQPAAGFTALRSYFDKATVLVCRPRPNTDCRLFVAIKAGGNGSHSHNDIGSFVIGIGKEQPLGDPGGPLAYTSETFGPLRYTKFKLFNSFGHPVPVVAGALQLDATKVHPKVLSTNFTDSQDEIVIDMTPAYDVKSLKKLTRTMRYNRDGQGSITIEDHFELTSPQQLETALPTHGTFKQIGSSTLKFTLGKESILADIDTPDGFDVTSEMIEENCQPFDRVGIKLKKPAQDCTIRITFHAATPVN